MLLEMMLVTFGYNIVWEGGGGDGTYESYSILHTSVNVLHRSIKIQVHKRNAIDFRPKVIIQSRLKNEV